MKMMVSQHYGGVFNGCWIDIESMTEEKINPTRVHAKKLSMTINGKEYLLCLVQQQQPNIFAAHLRIKAPMGDKAVDGGSQ